MQTLNRTKCSECGADCVIGEAACWQCGRSLIADTKSAEVPEASGTTLRIVSSKDRNAGRGQSKSSGLSGSATKADDTVLLAPGAIYIGEGDLPAEYNRPLKPPPPPPPSGLRAWIQKPQARQPLNSSEEEGEIINDTLQHEQAVAEAKNHSEPATKRFTLSGEEVIIEEAPVADAAKTQPLSTTMLIEPGAAAVIGSKTVELANQKPLMVLTFCKNCGLQNGEGIRECARCKMMLDIVEVGSVGEIVQPMRSWGFDLLGVAWVVLGFAAVYCNQFLIRVDPNKPGRSIADFVWTGIVVLAPATLIFMRHYFCKLLFWVMTWFSGLVWGVIGFLWYYVGIHISDNSQIALMWLAALSGLSVLSYFLVRTNDHFDFDGQFYH